MKKKLYKLTDGSWSLTVTEEGLEHTYPDTFKNNNIKYEIIAEHCVLPSSKDDWEIRCPNNDTIIRNITSGQIIFTQKRFLERTR